MRGSLRTCLGLAHHQRPVLLASWVRQDVAQVELRAERYTIHINTLHNCTPAQHACQTGASRSRVALNESATAGQCSMLAGTSATLLTCKIARSACARIAYHTKALPLDSCVALSRTITSSTTCIDEGRQCASKCICIHYHVKARHQDMMTLSFPRQHPFADWPATVT